MSEQWFDRAHLERIIRRHIVRVDSVLDIGSGIRPQRFFTPRVHICCDPHQEYLEVLAKRRGAYRRVPIRGTWQELLGLIPDKSVDSVFLLDLIEHLEKAEGELLLAACDRIVRRQIVVFTPLGFMAQDYTSDERDGWGLSGAKWQVHKSGWGPQDFPAWQILGCKAYHIQNGKGEPFDPPHGAFWAIKNQDGHTHAQVLDARRSAHVAVDAGFDIAHGTLDLVHDLERKACGLARKGRNAVLHRV